MCPENGVYSVNYIHVDQWNEWMTQKYYKHSESMLECFCKIGRNVFLFQSILAVSVLNCNCVIKNHRLSSRDTLSTVLAVALNPNCMMARFSVFPKLWECGKFPNLSESLFLLVLSGMKRLSQTSWRVILSCMW